MDKAYANTVRLLLSIAPDVFAGDVFAMKGGTAINLFVRDMPRLSVDIDVVYTPWRAPRDKALAAIGTELSMIAERLRERGLEIRAVAAGKDEDSKLLVSDGEAQVKIEVNPVYRGTVLPIERRSLTPVTSERFSAELELPMLAVDELYGSKLVASLDRQHPRDLFDVLHLRESGGITDGMIECFVTYLAGHNRPIHEVLFATPKDIEHAYHATFVGMTTEPVALDELLAAREWVTRELPERLTASHRAFLCGLVRADPDWSLLVCPHAEELPALRWKLQNLREFKARRPADFEEQAAMLERLLNP